MIANLLWPVGMVSVANRVPRLRAHDFVSGVPSVVFAGIVGDIVIPNQSLSGIYHVAVPSIAKADLSRLVADTYERDIRISLDDSLVIDRSLDAEKLAAATGYSSPAWPAMIQSMHNDFMKGYHHNV